MFFYFSNLRREYHIFIIYMSKKCYSDRTIQSIINANDDVVNVSSGEICTIENSIEYGIFHKKNYFKNNDDIDPLIGNVRNEKDFKYSLCHLDNENSNISYNNCVLSTSNPWMTSDDNSKLCILPDNIIFPKELEKVFDNNTSNYIFKKPDVLFRYIHDEDNENKLCEEKWYEWFSIPDYHLGNKNFYNTDDDKCYSKCMTNYLPVSIKTDTIDRQICVLKDEYMNGIYKGFIHYKPIALIFLLGSTKDDLINYYLEIFKKKLSDRDTFDIDIELYDHVLENNNTQNNIYQFANNEIKIYRDELILLPISSNNILVPNNTTPNNEDVSTLIFAYNMCKKIHDILNDGLAYNKWKLDLLSANGYTDLSDWRLNKQIILFKKASNILFNNQSDYSKKSILYKINYKSDIIRLPFEFDLNHNEETLLSYSENPAYNSKATEDFGSTILHQSTLKTTLYETGDNRRKKNSDIKNPSILSEDEDEKVISEKSTYNTIVYKPLFILYFIYHICFVIMILCIISLFIYIIYIIFQREINVLLNLYFLVFNYFYYKFLLNDNYDIQYINYLIKNVNNNIILLGT